MQLQQSKRAFFARIVLVMTGRPVTGRKAVVASPDRRFESPAVGALTEETRARMNRPSPKTVRRRFLIALGHAFMSLGRSCPPFWRFRLPLACCLVLSRAGL